MTQSPKPSDEAIKLAKEFTLLWDDILRHKTQECADSLAQTLQSYGSEQRRLGRAEAFEEAANLARRCGAIGTEGAIYTRAEQEREGGR